MKKSTKAVIAWGKEKLRKKHILESGKIPSYITKGKLMYPLTKQLLKLITTAQGERIFLLNKVNDKEIKNRSVIYANTHRFKPDFEKISATWNELHDISRSGVEFITE